MKRNCNTFKQGEPKRYRKQFIFSNIRLQRSYVIFFIEDPYPFDILLFVSNFRKESGTFPFYWHFCSLTNHHEITLNRVCEVKIIFSLSFPTFNSIKHAHFEILIFPICKIINFCISLC